MKNRIPVAALFTGVALSLTTLPAFGYLDPGSGSALLQGILAALAAIGLTLKLYWHRLARFLGIKKEPKSEFDVDSLMESDETSSDSADAKDTK